METLNACPVCNAGKFDPFLSCTDHTVSKKEFAIVSCKSCGFKFTNPRPTPADLGNYYKTEEYISHTDTQKGFVNRMYHFVRKYTLLKKLQLVVRICGGLSKANPKFILDIGCGTGAFLDVCNKAGFTSIGIEPDDDARKLAQNNYGLKIKNEGELETIQTGSIDVITLWHVLEHVPFLNERVSRIRELLKPNGVVLIAVPNCSSFDAKHYGKFWAAYDVPRHLYHFTPKDIQSLFEKHDMKVEQILPMRFDSFYVSMLSEKYKSGNINYLKAFWNGLRSNFSAIKTGNEFSSQIYLIKKI